MATAAVAGPPSQWVFVLQFTYDLIKGNKDILYLIGNVLALTFIENDCTAFNCMQQISRMQHTLYKETDNKSIHSI